MPHCSSFFLPFSFFFLFFFSLFFCLYFKLELFLQRALFQMRNETTELGQRRNKNRALKLRISFAIEYCEEYRAAGSVRRTISIYINVGADRLAALTCFRSVNFHRPMIRKVTGAVPSALVGQARNNRAAHTLTRHTHTHTRARPRDVIDWRRSPRATTKAVAITGIAGVALGKIQPVHILIRIMHR